MVRRAVQTGPGLFGDGETRWRAARVRELPPAASLTLVEARHARLVVIEDRELWRKRVRVQFWLGAGSGGYRCTMSFTARRCMSEKRAPIQ